ncbi:MAG: TRAP transporter small permease [Oscillospiraceae bacterium]
MVNTVNSLKKFGDKMNAASKILLGILCAVLTVIVIAQVLVRLFFNFNFTWVEELSIHLFIWQTMIGSAVATKYLGHIGVDVVVNKLPHKIKRGVQIVAYLFLIGTMVLFGITGFQFMLSQSTQYAVTIHYSMLMIYISVPLGCAMMIYHATVQLLELIFIGEIEVPENI